VAWAHLFKASVVVVMDLLTVKEAADLLKLSAGAVYALCKSGTLPHHRLGQGRAAIRIDRQDLLRYVEACKTGATPAVRGDSPSLAPKTPTLNGPLPAGGFKHLRVDRLLGRQRPADGPLSGRGDRSDR
jgi:excisionase family DNA binding protein